MQAAHRCSGVEATIALLEVSDVSRYGSVSVEQGRVISFEEKSPVSRPGKINAGVYLFDRSVVERIPEGKTLSLEYDVLPNLAAHGHLAAAEFKSDFIDIGLPESYAHAGGFVRRLFDVD
jgi:D-glycero-alpha-D-manno-heptose 1-phosphate guanylyltransferase